MSESNNQANLSDPNKKPVKVIKFSYFEPVVGIIIALAVSIVFYFFPHIIAIVFVSGPVIPTFNIEVINGQGSYLWIPILLWAVLRIGVEIVYLIERRYTKRLAIITMIGNTFAFICTLVIFLPVTIMNPEHIEWVQTHYINNAAWFGEILARANTVVIIIMLIGLILDSITSIRKGFKSKKVREDVKEDKDENISVKEVKIGDLNMEEAKTEEANTD